MKRLFHILLLALAIQAVGHIEPLSAQYVVWDIDFDFRFDNREYGDPSKMITPSTTIFGANIAPEVGISWGYGHSLLTGATLHADMGSENFFGKPEFIAYYNYSGTRLDAWLGLFPRNNLMGRYSRATFKDTYAFYQPTIEGAMIRYKAPFWFVELACDWNGLRSPTRREKFTILFAGEANKNLSMAGYNIMLHHHAASDTARGVVDNAMLNIYMGLDFSSLLVNSELAVQFSWLQGYQNDRLHIGTPTMPGGYEVDIKMRRDDIGLRNTFYKGDDLMPLWNLPYEDSNGSIYGPELYSGDPFYRVGEKGFYNRLELYWQPVIKGGVSLRFSSVHHFDGNHWGWQQVISLSVDIDSGMFDIIR